MNVMKNVRLVPKRMLPGYSNQSVVVAVVVVDAKWLDEGVSESYHDTRHNNLQRQMLPIAEMRLLLEELNV